MIGKGMWDTVEAMQERKEIGKDELKKVYSALGEIYKALKTEMGKVIAGQEEVIEQTLIAILTNNHAILEGYPGLAKTMMVQTLADIMELSFKRIQCTPDIMPSDITGTYIITEHAGRKEFKFEKGPIFANIVLADEINRATPKSQSALLESMQERQVTVGNTTYPLDMPFFVLATQNPIEMEGTYPLPEAQLDRFLLKVLVKYPSEEEEERIIKIHSGEKIPKVNKVITKEQLLTLQELTRMMPMSGELRKLVLNIVTNTRPENSDLAKQYLEYGASPRASIGLVLASKARALLNGRNYMNKEDIETMTYPILRHRIILNFESERKGVTTDNVIENILKEV